MKVPNINESVFDTTIQYKSFKIHLNDSIVNEIAPLWMKCLQLDSSREDVFTGLCTLYTFSANTKGLVNLCDFMQGKSYPSEALLKNLILSSNELINRGQYSSAMELLRYALKEFPEESTVYSNISALFYREDNLDSALYYCKIATEKCNISLNSYYRLGLLSTFAGKYLQALEALRAYSIHSKDNSIMIFEALHEYLNGNQSWKKRIFEYVKAEPSDTNNPIVRYAEFLISPDNRDNYESYLKSLSINLPVPFNFLVHERAYNEFQDGLQAAMQLAEVSAEYKNYKKAGNIYRGIWGKFKRITPEIADEIYLNYAWVLYRLSDDEANTYWEKCLKSDDLYIKSAGAYFLIKFYMDKGSDNKAAKIVKEIKCYLPPENIENSKYWVYIDFILNNKMY